MASKMGRFKYSARDDKTLLKFLLEELYAKNPDALRPMGNNLWDKAVVRGILNGQVSRDSMRDRVRRVLLPDLTNRPMKLCTLLNQDEICFMRKKLDLDRNSSRSASKLTEDQYRYLTTGAVEDPSVRKQSCLKQSIENKKSGSENVKTDSEPPQTASAVGSHAQVIVPNSDDNLEITVEDTSQDVSYSQEAIETTPITEATLQHQESKDIFSSTQERKEIEEQLNQAEEEEGKAAAKDPNLDKTKQRSPSLPLPIAQNSEDALTPDLEEIEPLEEELNLNFEPEIHDFRNDASWGRLLKCIYRLKMQQEMLQDEQHLVRFVKLQEMIGDMAKRYKTPYEIAKKVVLKEATAMDGGNGDGDRVLDTKEIESKLAKRRENIRKKISENMIQ